MTRFLAVLFFAAMAGAATQAAAAESEEERQVRTDCQSEGEAGGLSGSELEEFTESCVAELLEAELINVVD